MGVHRNSEFEGAHQILNRLGTGLGPRFFHLLVQGKPVGILVDHSQRDSSLLEQFMGGGPVSWNVLVGD